MGEELWNLANQAPESLDGCDQLCPKSSLCPKGWSQTSNGSCEAIGSYSGPCESIGSFAGMSFEEKSEYERRCRICWPCDVPAQYPTPRDLEGPVSQNGLCHHNVKM